ncbi:sensor histidine kinase [Halomicroarcula sp. GCM10025324]|uniref:sensor histidine kinase n=1 Tax=Halomicroarcula sp. GCM10025324 TaxID=3252667 RepID=UPI003623A5C4
MVSHDLRNPLNVIIGRTEFLMEAGEHDHLKAIERSCARMEEIISDLLALSRTNREIAEPESLPLASIANESWSSVKTEGAI